MKVSDLTVDELHGLIREFVHEELQEIMTDPDQGRQMTDQ